MNNSYISSDYAGLKVGEYHFYYGYEEPEHPYPKNYEGDDWDEGDWCFVVKKKNKEIMRIPSRELGDQFEVAECLLEGVAIFLKKELKLS